MLLRIYIVEDKKIAEVVLSRRNLLALLHKLDFPGSAQTLASSSAPDNWALVVRAEDDDEHYKGREEPPGPLIPESEEFVHRRSHDDPDE